MERICTMCLYHPIHKIENWCVTKCDYPSTQDVRVADRSQYCHGSGAISAILDACNNQFDRLALGVFDHVRANLISRHCNATCSPWDHYAIICGISITQLRLSKLKVRFRLRILEITVGAVVQVLASIYVALNRTRPLCIWQGELWLIQRSQQMVQPVIIRTLRTRVCYCHSQSQHGPLHFRLPTHYENDKEVRSYYTVPSSYTNEPQT